MRLSYLALWYDTRCEICSIPTTFTCLPFVLFQDYIIYSTYFHSQSNLHSLAYPFSRITTSISSPHLDIMTRVSWTSKNPTERWYRSQRKVNTNPQSTISWQRHVLSNARKSLLLTQPREMVSLTRSTTSKMQCHPQNRALILPRHPIRSRMRSQTHLVYFSSAPLSLVASHTIDAYFAFKRRARSIQKICFVTTLLVHLDRIQQVRAVEFRSGFFTKSTAFQRNDGLRYDTARK